MSTVSVITIDGPSGAGKGTIAHLLAGKLGWHLLDSGALYRVTAYACEVEGVGLADESAVADIARHLQVSFLRADSGEVLVCYRDRDCSRAIRTEEGGRGASTVGAMPLVRKALLQRQRDFQQAPGWSRTVAIWVPSCFPMPRSSFSSSPVPKSAPSGAISS